MARCHASRALKFPSSAHERRRRLVRIVRAARCALCGAGSGSASKVVSNARVCGSGSTPSSRSKTEAQRWYVLTAPARSPISASNSISRRYPISSSGRNSYAPPGSRQRVLGVCAPARASRTRSSMSTHSSCTAVRTATDPVVLQRRQKIPRVLRQCPLAVRQGAVDVLSGCRGREAAAALPKLSYVHLARSSRRASRVHAP